MRRSRCQVRQVATTTKVAVAEDNGCELGWFMVRILCEYIFCPRLYQVEHRVAYLVTAVLGPGAV